MPLKKEKLKKIIWQTLEYPKKPWQKSIASFLDLLVMISVVILILELSHPQFFVANHGMFLILEGLILGFFVIDFVLLLYSSPKKFQYLTSWSGVITFLAVVPSLMAIVFGLEALLPSRLVKLTHTLHLDRLLRQSRSILFFLKSVKWRT